MAPAARQSESVGCIEEASRVAHETLWKQLEEVHIRFRRAPDPDADDEHSLETALRETNLLFLRNSLYFNDRDQALIHDYIAALDRLRNAVRLADRNSRREWDITAIGDLAAAADTEQNETGSSKGRKRQARHPAGVDLRNAQTVADKLRASVKAKLRKGAGLD